MEFLCFDKEGIASFTNNDDLFNYISEIENSKLLESHPDFGKTNWSFATFSPEHGSQLHNNMKKQSVTEMLKEAYEKEPSLIEICKGDYENPIQILVTPDLDIKGLKVCWCLEYIKAYQDKTNAIE